MVRASAKLVARCAALVRHAERRPVLAYGIALACVAFGLTVLHLLQGLAGAGVVPFATLFPALAAGALVGGIGPGLAALLASAAGGWQHLERSAALSGDGGMAALNLILFLVAGGVLVAFGALARSALLRFLAGQERLMLAVRSTGLGTWDVDGLTGSRRWSKEFRDILGLDDKAPADLDLFTSLIHPEDRTWAAERYRAAYAARHEGRFEAEFRICRADNGAERWVQSSGRVYFDMAGKPVRAAGTLLDVTSRRLTESALRESEARYRTLVDLAPDAVHVHRDGVIIFANQQAARLFGARSPEEIVGRGALDLVDPASLPLARSRTALLRQPGQRNPPVELTIRRLDGATTVVEANSAAVVLDGQLAVLAVLRDATERLRGEAALRESETRFRLAAAATQGIVYDLDLVAGTVWRSDGLRRVVGVRPDMAEASERWWLERIHPDDAPRFAADHRLLDDPVVVNLDCEYRVRHAVGHWVHLHDRAFVVRDPQGRPLRLIGVATDITERKAAEARQALMAREVDHRARNALAVVQSLVRLTRSDDPDAFACAIEDRVGALARIHTLLAENQWQDIDLRRLLEDDLASYRGLATITLKGPAVSLRAKAVQPFALMLHELGLNAARHGALGVAAGALDLSWTFGPRGELQLRWGERGGPPVATAHGKRGFGLALIEATARGQLGGNVELAWPSTGLRARITIAPDMLGAVAPAANAASA